MKWESGCGGPWPLVPRGTANFHSEGEPDATRTHGTAGNQSHLAECGLVVAQRTVGVVDAIAARLAVHGVAAEARDDRGLAPAGVAARAAVQSLGQPLLGGVVRRAASVALQ